MRAAAGGLIGCCLAGPARALADESPAGPSALAPSVAWAAQDARSSRQAMALVQGLLGAAMLAPGLILVARGGQESSQITGAGFAVAGTMQLLTLPLLLMPSPIERVQEGVLHRTAAGDADPLGPLETELREAAERAHASRPYLAAGQLVIGVASVAVGMAFHLAQPGVAGMGRSTQLILGSALVGVGSPLMTRGIRGLLLETPEELAWERYRQAPNSQSRAPGTAPVFVSIGPTNGGLFGTLGVAL